MRILFRRREIGECVSVIHRRDGVVLELPSYSRKHRIPHDVAHAVTERELRISGGVFGLIASGYLFVNMTVVSGKVPHDAKARGERLMKAHGGSITTAEVLAGAVHHAVENGQSDDAYPLAVAAWGSTQTGPFPWHRADLERAAAVLAEHDRRWQEVGVGEDMEFTWPDSLSHAVPARAKANHRSAVRARR